jgi:hypothetical protein
MSFFYDDLTEHPDCIQLEIAGKEVNWLLTKQAFDKAQEEGIDLTDFDDVEEEDVRGNLEALATLLYIGTLPFEDGPSKEDFDLVMTPRTAAEVGPKVMAQFQGLADEEVEAVVGKDQ